MKNKMLFCLIIVLVVGIILISFYFIERNGSDINQTDVEPTINESEGQEVKLPDEQKILVEDLIRERYPEVLDKIELSLVKKISDNPNILVLYYISPNTSSESFSATIMVDLENEKITFIERSWRNIYNPRCCLGINFYNELYAEDSGYTNCILGECEIPPTDEEKQEWECPKIEHANCIPAIMPEMTPYCYNPYEEWIKENCPNISFSY